MDKGYKITALPVYHEGYKGEMDVISRKINRKGELAALSVGETHYISAVNFLKGREPRANHYHLKKAEYLYILKGRVRLYFRDRRGGIGEVETLEVNEGSLVFIEPGVSHAVEALEDGYGIEFSPDKFDEDDNYKDVITE